MGEEWRKGLAMEVKDDRQRLGTTTHERQREEEFIRRLQVTEEGGIACDEFVRVIGF